MEKQVSTPSLLTRLEVCKLLRCTATTLGRLKIPKVKIRRRVFYRLETINTWIVASERLKEADL
jgi:hypothetical protein